MAKSSKLANAEAEIMDCIWNLPQPVTVRQVHTALYPDNRKAYTTVQTFMNILAEKGWLQRQKQGQTNIYTAIISRETAAVDETRSLVSRLFQGSFGALAHHLIHSGELGENDLRELKRMIAEAEAKSRES